MNPAQSGCWTVNYLTNLSAFFHSMGFASSLSNFQYVCFLNLFLQSKRADALFVFEYKWHAKYREYISPENEFKYNQSQTSF